MLDSDRYPPVPLILHLDYLSIEDSIARTSWAIQQNIIDSKANGSKVRNLLDTHGELQAKELRKVIPLILYICSDNAEIKGLYSHDTFKRSMKDKISFEFPEANNTVIWDVGKRIGEDIRKFKEIKFLGGSQTKSNKAQKRRAQWITGPRASQDLVVRWLTPIQEGI